MQLNFSVSKRNELKHYGVKGMQWGVRKDGKRGSSRGPQARAVRLSQMSDDELRRHLNRIDMERKYHSIHKSSFERGREQVMKVLSKSAMTALQATATKQLTKIGMELSKSLEASQKKS